MNEITYKCGHVSYSSFWQGSLRYFEECKKLCPDCIRKEKQAPEGQVSHDDLGPDDDVYNTRWTIAEKPKSLLWPSNLLEWAIAYCKEEEPDDEYIPGLVRFLSDFRRLGGDITKLEGWDVTWATECEKCGFDGWNWLNKRAEWICLNCCPPPGFQGEPQGNPWDYLQSLGNQKTLDEERAMRKDC